MKKQDESHSGRIYTMKPSQKRTTPFTDREIKEALKDLIVRGWVLKKGKYYMASEKSNRLSETCSGIREFIQSHGEISFEKISEAFPHVSQEDLKDILDTHYKKI